MTREVVFTVEGFRPGHTESVKRGVKIIIPDNYTKEEFLEDFSEAVESLYRHECQCLDE